MLTLSAVSWSIVPKIVRISLFTAPPVASARERRLKRGKRRSRLQPLDDGGFHVIRRQTDPLFRLCLWRLALPSRLDKFQVLVRLAVGDDEPESLSGFG
jgi:hypothetical protein